MRSKYHHLQSVVKSNVMVGSRKALIGRVAWFWSLQKAIVVAVGGEELARYISKSAGEVFPITFVLDDHPGTLRRGTDDATNMMTRVLAFTYRHSGFNNITSAKRVGRILLGLTLWKSKLVCADYLPLTMSHRFDR